MRCILCLAALLLLMTGSVWALEGHPEALPAGKAPIAPEPPSRLERFADWLQAGGFGLYRQNYAVFSHGEDAAGEDHTELKFQLSFRQGLGGSGLYAAYTQVSFWRIFDGPGSRPFRETNYSPELFWRVPGRWLPDEKTVVDLGLYQHQSNGLAEPTSRSWDRSYLRLFRDFGPFNLEFKLWHRWKEKAKRFPTDPAGDENPDILDYYGHGELRLGVDLDYVLARAMVRHNFATDRGAVQVDLSLPIGTSNIALYVQFWDGYGESLIDYNRSLTKVGAGLRIR